MPRVLKCHRYTRGLYREAEKRKQKEERDAVLKRREEREVPPHQTQTPCAAWFMLCKPVGFPRLVGRLCMCVYACVCDVVTRP